MTGGNQTPTPRGTPASGSSMLSPTLLPDEAAPPDSGSREAGRHKKKSKEKSKDAVSGLHEELEEKLRSVDLEAEDAFKNVIGIYTSALYEGRYYKTSTSFLKNVGLYMAQLYAFKCEEVANERAQRIQLLQELAENKAQRERERERNAVGSVAGEHGHADQTSNSEGMEPTVRRGTGNRPERATPGHTAGMGPNPPSAASGDRQRGNPQRGGRDGRPVPVGEAQRRAPGQPSQRRAESRAVNRDASQGEDAGWTQVGRNNRSRQRKRSGAPQRGRPKHLLVTTLTSRLQGVPEGRRWPNLSNEDYDTCLKKMQEAALMEEGAQWRILGMWRTSFGLAIELGDRETLQDILRAPPPGMSVRELAQKSCELSISDIPLALANEQGLRREIVRRNGIPEDVPWEIVKICTKKDAQGEPISATAIVKMEEAVANRFLGKGGRKDALYIGATRVGHQQRDCTLRNLPASQRTCGHCKCKGHGSMEYMKCDAGRAIREAGVPANELEQPGRVPVINVRA
ncbi:hypothetical protein Pmar_PMAR022053 [Perkinsus marinus ATCC 50983]|uniref:Uncharacterized protein n=3 Tax=Perkinsus marinus (strain ATCC 50983 / TXsc) TaxID=423536 RepID=C5K9A5_PERM5|nr:hypothetical protein Pmar_PMAR022053 [Perkinsus marinus ATCC 50983]EER18946.1 hypothetical protein Pmar_PMAR022053 [Perkinsus marinus ATCC 50983]|eukprot:XP_002787150.1 hypothetical protein Pmar_PMAR022053 [Perkinsus marinus ATCC 50983]